MIRYADDVAKRVARGFIPPEIFVNINNALTAINTTGDLNLFDTKRLKDANSDERIYYRLRKGKYRAIFFMENNAINVTALDKREDVYHKWQ